MKKLYILAVASICAVQANAQNFSYDVGTSLHSDLVTNTYANADINFTTEDSAGITFGWELISNDIPTGWSYSLCDYQLCYSGIPASGTMTNISGTEFTNGTTAYFKFNINPWEIAGSATVKFWLHDQADYNLGDTVTFTFTHVSSVGTEESELSNLGIYPNPANDQVTFSNISSEITQIQIFNIVGELVEFVQPTASTLNLDLTSYQPGAYFVTCVNKEGVRRTEKLVVR